MTRTRACSPAHPEGRADRCPDTAFELLVARLRHKQDKDRTCDGGGGGEGEECRRISEMVDHLSDKKAADGGAIPWVVAIAPCARLYRPVPRMMSAITSGVSAW